MLSRISKISVFGIVALMLAFGLTAGDAFAQVPAAGPNTLTVTASPDPLRAAGTATMITFTLTVVDRVDVLDATPATPATPAGTVTVNIPFEWTSRPIEDNGDTIPDAGEVTFKRGSASGRDVGRVSNRNLIITIPEGIAGNGTYTVVYNMATVPHREGSYRFSVTGADYTDTDGDGTVDDLVTVTWAESGKGTIALAPHAPQGEFKIGPEEVLHAYNGKYVFVSKEDLGDVRFTFTAPGSLPPETQFKVTMAGFDLTERPNDITTASVSGHGAPEITRLLNSVTATVKAVGGLVKGNTITLTIKGLVAPEVLDDAFDTPGGYAFTASTATATENKDGTFTASEAFATDFLEMKGVFDFYTTAPAGTGELAITSVAVPALNPLLAANGAVVEGMDLGVLTFGIDGVGGFGPVPGSRYEIKIPVGFPAPTEAITIIGGNNESTLAGHTVGGTPDSVARTISGILPTSGISPTYRVGVISAPGRHFFGLRTTPGPHDGLAERTGGEGADLHPRYIDVTASHDSFLFDVRENGASVVQSRPTAVHNLQLVFTATGYMPTGTVVFSRPTQTAEAVAWPAFRNDNGDSVADPGEVSSTHAITVSTDGTTVTATGSWSEGTQVIVSYKSATVPGAVDSAPIAYMFSAAGSSFNHATNMVTKTHTIGPGRAGAGSGTLAISPDSVNSNLAVDVTLTFKAEGIMGDGSEVKLILPPAPWPRLTAAGTSVDVSNASWNSDADSITATTVNDLAKDATIVFKISGVTTPQVGGPYRFTAESKADPGGIREALGAGATITINQVAAGTATLELVKADGTMADSAEPLDAFETVKITFTAGVAMQSGAEVRVTVPDGWMNEPFEDNGMPRTSGEVTLEGNADADLDVEGRVLIATANAQINPRETVTFTYHMPTAPEGETTSSFDTQASLVEDGGLLRVANQQTRVVVRSKVTALTLTADSATSVFVGDPVELTVRSDARAPVGGLTVSLAIDLADTGMFSLTKDGAADSTVIIGDSATSMSTTLYYIAPDSIDMESVDVILTATAMVDGEAVTSDPVEVEVRSRISRLQVNGIPDPDAVEVGDTITVSAIGQDGKATVRVVKKKIDADGVEIITSVVGSVSLDEDHLVEVSEGSVAYTRDLVLTDIDEGSYTVEVTIAGEMAEINIEVVASRESVTALTLTASAENFLAGESITVTVALNARAPIGGLEVTLSTDPADSGTFSMTEGGEANSTVMIEDSADSMSAMVYYTNATAGAVALMAAAGDDLEASVDVEVNPTISVQVNGMDDEPEAVLPGATISVTATGKAGGGTVMVTDAEGEAVGALTGLGLNVDDDAADVPEGSVAYMRDIELPADIADGTYTVTVTIGSESVPVEIEVMTPTEPVTAIAVEADPTSVFVGEDINVAVTLWDADGEGEASAAMVINLSDGDAGGSFTDAEGNAITSVTIAVGGIDASATYRNDSEGDVTLTATVADEESELEPATVEVTVKSFISNLRVVNDTGEPGPLMAGDTITVSATGKEGKATVTVTDADGEPVVPSKGLTGLDEEPDEEGNVDYTRDIDLPADLADGIYTVTVTIAGETAKMEIEVINDQSPPMLSSPNVLPDTVASGSVITLTIEASSNVPNPELSVTADVSAIDADDPDVQLLKQPGTESTYVAIYVVKNSDPKDDGETTIMFAATDRLGGTNEMTATTSLRNDVTPPVLSDESAMPSPVVNGTVVTISVSSESGLTVTADASAIGGDAAVALDEGMMAADGNGMDANGNGNGMDANGNGNGMAANGNGNGMAANGNGNGMDANGNGNGMDANGNGNGDNGMTETAMPAGNGMYSGMVTVTDAEDGEQTITITATDGSGNSITATVFVMIDNTGAMLSDASADPTMATSDTEVTLSVNGGESGLTVTADASAIGGGEVELTEGMDDMYSATVTVTDAEDGEQMVTISATDALGNESEAVMVSVTVDNTGAMLSDASADPAEAVNGDMVTISVMGGESGLTVMADASELGAEADVELAESADTAGSYSGSVDVNADSGGDKMVSITATDALGNASEAVTVTVSVHEVTSVSFSPAQVSTGDTVTVTAMGTAGLTATFSVFDAEGMNIIGAKAMTESDDGGSYTGSFIIVAYAHPTGEYWVSASVGQASMTADDALTIDHKAQFTLSIPAGTHAIHVPLDVTHIDGEAGTIETVGNLYDALGDSVNFIITLGADGNWMSYLGDESAGSMADAEIGDDTGLIAVMKSAATLELTGNALGAGGYSMVSINVGNNLVGVPLDSVVDMMISDALVEGVGAIAVSKAAGDGFHTIQAAGDTGDGPVMGGVGYIVVATAAASIPIYGSAWENEGAVMAAPGVVFSGSQTPVLHVDGSVMDEFDMLSRIPELRVTVRNLSTGASLDTVLGTAESTTAYSATFVEFGRHAARAGDVLEIVAHSPNPYVGVRPVPQIVVSAEEVLTSRISLPDMELYEIPSESELLANYPNPFNPETWIPYRLAQAAEVTLDIYDTNGRLVRTIDIGFKPAAVYESRASAIYWDGRNNYGERVASGTYFYHLTAGDDYASTRRMVILK